MFQIHIDNITEKGSDLDQQADASSLPLLMETLRDGSISFVQPVRARIHATMTGETVHLTGNVQTRVRLACSRCLEPFESTLENDFSVSASREMSLLSDGDAANEIELEADRIDVIAYSGDHIDLRDEIAQQIIMTLPIKALCRETCKGLCGGCGVDLNRSSCTCTTRNEHTPFAVLERISFPGKKE